MNLKIWVYSITYNEGHFVKHFLHAYKEAERIVIYDNQSTDNTVELLLQDPRVEVREYDSDNMIRDDYYLDIKNHSWKEARGKADWVIVVDFDEIFQHCWKDDYGEYMDLNLREIHSKGFNMIRPHGYNMISLDAPLGMDGHPYQYSKMATYHRPEEKMCCFKPDELSEINYSTGAHGATPFDKMQGTQGIRVCTFPEFKLLHFKFWNLEHYMKRMEEYQKRLSPWNKKMGAGWHYMESLEYHRNLVINGSKIAVPLFQCPRPE